MKHSKKITIIILSMFLIAQFIGLYVVNFYSGQEVVDGKIVLKNDTKLPYGMGVEQPKEESKKTNLVSIIFSFIIAIAILILLSRIRAKFVLKTWFFIVTILGLGIAITSFIGRGEYASYIALLIALPLAFWKIYKRDIVVHNLSELIIYPGIAAVFVPLLGTTSIIILLIALSVYDMWAVWKSKIMQKMANFQMNELRIFSGFIIPYADRKTKEKIRKLKLQQKKKKFTDEELAKKKIKINLGILGGGDVVFPIITAGVILKTWGLIPALITILGAFCGLAFLLLYSNKKKFYPAMPFITAGIFIGMLIGYII